MRCESFFPPSVPPLDRLREIVPLKAPQPEEANLQEKGMAQETEGEAPSIVEHARIQRNDGQGVCVMRGYEYVSDLDLRALT